MINKKHNEVGALVDFDCNYGRRPHRELGKYRGDGCIFSHGSVYGQSTGVGGGSGDGGGDGWDPAGCGYGNGFCDATGRG